MSVMLAYAIFQSFHVHYPVFLNQIVHSHTHQLVYIQYTSIVRYISTASPSMRDETVCARLRDRHTARPPLIAQSNRLNSYYCSITSFISLQCRLRCVLRRCVCVARPSRNSATILNVNAFFTHSYIKPFTNIILSPSYHSVACDARWDGACASRGRRAARRWQRGKWLLSRMSLLSIMTQFIHYIVFFYSLPSIHFFYPFLSQNASSGRRQRRVWTLLCQELVHILPFALPPTIMSSVHTFYYHCAM
jgi:hypothetical protein